MTKVQIRVRIIISVVVALAIAIIGSLMSQALFGVSDSVSYVVLGVLFAVIYETMKIVLLRDPRCDRDLNSS